MLESIVVEEFNSFEENLHKIQAITSDTLIIWGEDDKVSIFQEFGFVSNFKEKKRASNCSNWFFESCCM